MRSDKIELHETHQFSSIFLDYLSGKDNLKPFYGLSPTAANLKQQLKNKSLSRQDRQLLQQVLQEQYLHLPQHRQVQQNIELLAQENTYTITTGHQLNIFTGPLYFIYKIVTAINACRQLQEEQPDKNFVPVYWMASEDHDFAEISYFNLFGKKYQWETEQSGPVGHFSPNGLGKLLEELPEPMPLFEKAYTENDTLADAVRQYVHELFAEWGVVVLDADHPQLKASFADIIKADILENKANELVAESSEQLQELGYKAQVFPREINFFYMKPGLRERIVREEGAYKVLNTDLSFTEEGLLEELSKHPERFSPNVIMRPLYQERILPNLAYVGGPGEFAYWLQLKGVFDHFNIPFPILLPRNFALVINKSNQHKLEKTGLEPQQLFSDAHELKQELLEQNAEQEISLEEESRKLSELFSRIQEKAAAVDKSLEGFVGAESSKAQKSLDNIQKRIKKSEERKHETILNQVDSLKEKLFPGNSLQERSDNFLNFYINDPAFIRRLVEQFDPFDFRFNLLTYNE